MRKNIAHRLDSFDGFLIVYDYDEEAVLFISFRRTHFTDKLIKIDAFGPILERRLFQLP